MFRALLLTGSSHCPYPTSRQSLVLVCTSSCYVPQGSLSCTPPLSVLSSHPFPSTPQWSLFILVPDSWLNWFKSSTYRLHISPHCISSCSVPQGSVPRLTTAGEGLDDARWHTVRLRSPDGLRLFAAVDEGASDLAGGAPRQVRAGVAAAAAGTVRLTTGTFVGGLPATVCRRPLELAVPTVAFERRLDGAVRRVHRSRCGRSAAESPAMLVAGRGMSPADRRLDDRCAQDSPCLHGGVCVNTPAGPLCECDRTDYDGMTCSIGESRSPSASLLSLLCDVNVLSYGRSGAMRGTVRHFTRRCTMIFRMVAVRYLRFLKSLNFIR